MEKRPKPAPKTAPTAAADPPDVLARFTEGRELVEMLATYMRRRTSGLAHLDDMRSSGNEALLRAARTYSPDRGVPFDRYASLLIRGAMIDQIRQMTDLPKRVFRKLRALQAAEEIYAIAEEERGAATPLSPEEADSRLRDQLASAAMAMALGMLAKAGHYKVDDAESEDRSPESQASANQLIDRVKAVLADRSPEERLVIQRHYFEEVSIEEVGKELGVSKSWASRLHTRAIEALVKSLNREKE